MGSLVISQEPKHPDFHERVPYGFDPPLSEIILTWLGNALKQFYCQ